MHEEHHKKPRRRILLTLKVGADDRDALIHELEQITFELRIGHLWGESASGGYAAGYTMRVSEDPTVTHESYLAEITAKDERDAHAANL